MRCKVFLSTLVLGLSASYVQAQHAHSDVEVGYDSLITPTVLDFEVGESTSDGIPYFEAGFEQADPFNPGDFSSDAPGFTTNAAENLLIRSGDRLFLSALNASLHSSVGVGFVNFYNPLTNALQATGRISVIDNSTGTADLILNGASIQSGPNFQFIDAGDGTNNIHDHVVFDLLDDSTAPFGAYGIMFQLHSDFGPGDGISDLTSEPFWLIWNHGMSDVDFETLAVPAFGPATAAIPEPSSLALLTIGSTLLLARRRKSRA